MVRDENPSKVTFRSMGEPSWLVLQVLEPDDAIPAVEIIRRVERLLTAADYPRKHLDPSTLHYALRRMEDDGMINCEGRREVDVPSPRGGTRREIRPVYSITEVGVEMLRYKRKLDAFFGPCRGQEKATRCSSRMVIGGSMPVSTCFQIAGTCMPRDTSELQISWSKT